MSDTFVIVGASHAGAELAMSLRQNGHAGRIVMVGDEPHLPYQRPPLSKAYLHADAASAPQLLRPQAAYAQARVETLTGVRVHRIDREARQLRLSDGGTLGYDRLALTTGARVRRLVDFANPAADAAANLHYLRTAADAAALRTQMQPGRRLVVIGGGYVGLEVAASASKVGLQVTVLEAQPRVLARVTGELMARFYESVHRAAGVALRTATQFLGFEMDGVRIDAVRCRDLASGRDDTIAADIVVVGIGVVPNSELAGEAGLRVDDGIVVDAFARTSDPLIVAAGDCTRHPNEIVGRPLRLESVQNAVEQARVAAATLCGKALAYAAVPWFWSDQFDLKLQMVGLSSDHDEAVLRGDPSTRSFSVFYLRAGRLVAADVVNRPKDFMAARRLIGAGCTPPSALLADDAADLAAWAKAHDEERSRTGEKSIDAARSAALG